MRTKMIIAGIITACILPVVTFSQMHPNEFGDKKEKIEAFKIAFITQRLNLTPEEAQRFWPVYYQNHDRIEGIHKDFQKKYGELLDDIDNITDEQAGEILNGFITMQNEKVKAEGEMILEMKKILPAKKILKLHRAEEDFKRVLLQKIREMRGPLEE
jgi:hypothetical protein